MFWTIIGFDRRPSRGLDRGWEYDYPLAWSAPFDEHKDEGSYLYQSPCNGPV